MVEGVDWPEWLNVSRETNDRLERLASMVIHWSARINLVSKSAGENLWYRHIFDSAQIFSLRPSHCDHWVDIGSGGGFPGLVVAVLARELEPNLQVDLVESDQRKAVFLKEAARHLGLPTKVHAHRIEELPPFKADVLSARALAPLVKLCGFAKLHLDQGGTALFLKGQSHVSEIRAARDLWSFSLKTHQSKTDLAAVILELKDLQHV